MVTTTEPAWVGPRRWSVWALLGTAVAVVAAGLIQFNGLTDRPPGFYLDESSYAYNAWTIAQHGVDEHGLAWPVIFEASKDKPVLFSALACADVLLTLDRRDFRDLLGHTIYGLRVSTPGEFLRIERESGRLH